MNSSQTQAGAPAPTNQPDTLPMQREFDTYRRELPRLLEEGHANRYALIKGDEVMSVWDTRGDALQAGREKYGLEPIAVQRIDPRDPERLTFLDRRQPRPCPS